MNNQPLKGIRVADFGWVLAVPHATAWLSMIGADVIRVESAARLDIVRNAGSRAGADGVNGLDRGAFFNGLNMSKRGITLNLANPKGVDLAKRLIAMSDVVTENFATGVFGRFGLGYDVLKQIKPDIIMLSGSPLGQTGPDRNATGWGPNTQAYSGLPHITGYEGGPPSGIGALYPDYMIGVAMAFALLTAIHHRQRTGEGQLIDFAMAETVSTMIPEAIIEYTMNGREWPRMGSTDLHMAPHGVYRCKGEDTWTAIAIEDDAAWQGLRSALGEPDWARAESFDTLAGRKAGRDVIDAGISEWTRERTHYQVMHELQAAGVAAAPSLEVRELIRDPQMVDRGIFVEVDHPATGPRQIVGLPGKYSGIPEWDLKPSPMLGQHNEEVYGSLFGMTPEQIQALVDEKVIF